MLTKAPAGVEDILPDEAPGWRYIEDKARTLFGSYGYREIRLPLLEHTVLFRRSVGEATDIVEKEMYTCGEGEDSVTFRPEITAGIVRAYIENNLHKKKAFQKVFTTGPVFRHERPQKGRFRQHHQLDIEALGAVDPYLDAEIITAAADFFKSLGLVNYKIVLNSTGCKKCKPGYRNALSKSIKPRLEDLCENCRKRFERNVFRILDCKNEKCREATAEIPPIKEHLCEECASHQEKVEILLSGQGVDFEIDPRLVRGLDYYTKTVFEIKYPGLGAQDAIGGGGRYDGLIEELGGPDLGAVGFGLGIERIMLALESDNVELPAAGGGACVFVATVSMKEKEYAFEVAQRLRRAGISTEMDYENRSLKAQMKTANKIGAGFVLVLGPDEKSAGKVRMKNMETGDEKVLGINEAITSIKPND